MKSYGSAFRESSGITIMDSSKSNTRLFSVPLVPGAERDRGAVSVLQWTRDVNRKVRKVFLNPASGQPAPLKTARLGAAGPVSQDAVANRFFRPVLGAVAFSLFLCATTALSQAPAQNGEDRQRPPAIVVGFVGGHVHRNDVRHSEEQLIKELQATYGNRVRAEIFENRSRTEALRFILRTLNASNKIELSNVQEQRPRIILFGHSWGASAAVYLARDLQRYEVPVALTIQVDSVPKHGKDDSVIPPNVSEAINFYQDQGRLHGNPAITASGPSHTAILGNFRYQYVKEPAECRAYPWYDRLLYKGHTSIECDPQVWSKVSALIREQLPPPETKVAGIPQEPTSPIRAK